MNKRPPEAEEAYEIWAGPAGRSDVKTAELTGIPRRTISNWRLTHGWRERYLRIGSEDGDLIAKTAVMTMRQGMDLVTERMIAIVGEKRPQLKADGSPVLDPEGNPVMVWASKDADAIKASQLLAQYALGPANTAPGLDTSIPTTYQVSEALPGEYEALPEPEDATPEDLASLRQAAASMLEETAMRVNTRVEPGRRRGERV